MTHAETSTFTEMEGITALMERVNARCEAERAVIQAARVVAENGKFHPSGWQGLSHYATPDAYAERLQAALAALDALQPDPAEDDTRELAVHDAI